MRYIVMVVLFLSVSLGLSAQESGFSVRYRLSYGASWLRGTVPTNSLDTANQDCKCPNYTEYSGAYASQTFGVDYMFAEVAHVGVDVGVQSHHGWQQVPGESLPSLDGDGKVVMNITRWYGSASTLDAKTRLYAALDLPGSFFVEVGALALMNVSNRVSSVLRLISPAQARFDPSPINGETIENGRGKISYDRELPDFPSARFDIDAWPLNFDTQNSVGHRCIRRQIIYHRRFHHSSAAIVPDGSLRHQHWCSVQGLCAGGNDWIAVQAVVGCDHSYATTILHRFPLRHLSTR